MTKRFLTLFFCLVVFFTYPMREDDRNQNNENISHSNNIIEYNRIEDRENRNLLLRYLDNDELVSMNILDILLEKIPLIKFLPSDDILEVPYNKKIFQNIIAIVERCSFDDESSQMESAFKVYEKIIKKRTEEHKKINIGKNILSSTKKQENIEKITKIREQILNKKNFIKERKSVSDQECLVQLQKKYNDYLSNKKSNTPSYKIQPNNNIDTIKEIFNNQSLLNRIETILLAEYLYLPSSLIDDIIHALNIDIMSYHDLISIKQYNDNKDLCTKIKKILLLKRDYSHKKLSLVFTPHTIPQTEEDEEFMRNYSIQFSPQGECLALALNGESLNIWNYKKKKTNYIAFKEAYVTNLAFNNEGTILATKVGKSRIFLWGMERKNELLLNIKKEQCLFSNQFSSGDMAFSKNGKLLYSGGETNNFNPCALENDTETCKSKIFCKSNDFNNEDMYPFSHITRLDSSIAVAIDMDILIYNMNGDFRKKIEAHDSSINALRYNSDKKIFASCSNDATIILWSDTYYQVFGTLKGHTAAITDIAFSPDGETLVSTSLDKTIKLWNTKTGMCTTTIECKEPIIAVAFNNNGRLICAVSNNANISLMSLGTPENLSLQQILLLMYCQEKKGQLSSQYKDLYMTVPTIIQKQINKPHWHNLQKKGVGENLELFKFEKKKKK